MTAVPGRTEMLLDQRHLDPDALAAMLAEARDACEQAAADHGCEVELQHLWSIPPIPFDDRLIGFARQAVQDAGGKDTAIPSGPLHDAAEMARLIPTVMLFSSSSPPVSHTKEEDTPEADLRVLIDAYGRTVAGHARERGRGRPAAARVSALSEQLAYLEASSPFYARAAARRARAGAERRRPAALPVHHQGGAARGPACASRRSARTCARRASGSCAMHVTSGTTGEPVAVGLHASATTRPTARWAARRSGSRACAPTTSIAHCLNYALYAGGIADHMALEASGATVVPVGIGQSRRLLELIPQLGITAIFGTLSFPAYLAARAREARRRAARARHPPHRHGGRAGRGARRRARARSRRRGARRVADSFGMSDVWSTMGGRVRGGRGGAPDRRTTTPCSSWSTRTAATPLELEDGASGELVWTHLRREASPLLRYRSGDLGAGVDVAVRVRPRRRRASASTAAATTCCACRR